MEILIYKLLHMFEKQVLMLSVFYLKNSFQHVVTSQPSFDSSAKHSSRPSFAGTSTIGYDAFR